MVLVVTTRALLQFRICIYFLISIFLMHFYATLILWVFFKTQEENLEFYLYNLTVCPSVYPLLTHNVVIKYLDNNNISTSIICIFIFWFVVVVVFSWTTNIGINWKCVRSRLTKYKCTFKVGCAIITFMSFFLLVLRGDGHL